MFGTRLNRKRKEKTGATVKTTDRLSPYPYKEGKKKKKGQYRNAPVNLKNYMVITPVPSPSVVSKWQAP